MPSTYGGDLGFHTTVKRGCVRNVNSLKTGCEKNGERDMSGFRKKLFFENCNTTCTTDGCNFGTGYSSSLTTSISLGLIIALFFSQ